MIEYWKTNWPIMVVDLQQHATMVLASLGIALVIAGLIIILLMHRKNWLNGLVYFFSLLYSVPSFAFFTLLLPVSGLGMRTAIIVLTLYCEYVLLRTFITGIREVAPSLVEVSKGMGMTTQQVFFKVQLPLATPAILVGCKLPLHRQWALQQLPPRSMRVVLVNYYLRDFNHNKLSQFYGGLFNGHLNSCVRRNFEIN